eukprot:scaffold6156_cov132-Skeletonema_dohrnii-CCMP3373.AAC.3
MRALMHHYAGAWRGSGLCSGGIFGPSGLDSIVEGSSSITPRVPTPRIGKNQKLCCERSLPWHKMY